MTTKVLKAQKAQKARKVQKVQKGKTEQATGGKRMLFALSHLNAHLNEITNDVAVLLTKYRENPAAAGTLLTEFNTKYGECGDCHRPLTALFKCISIPDGLNKRTHHRCMTCFGNLNFGAPGTSPVADGEDDDVDEEI